MFDAAFSKPLSADWVLSNRYWIETRWVNRQYSTRYRVLLQGQKTVPVGEYVLTSYGSVEGFYDTRFDLISRWLLTVGVQFPIQDDYAVDVYFSHQDDRRQFPRYVNALGLSVSVFL